MSDLVCLLDTGKDAVGEAFDMPAGAVTFQATADAGTCSVVIEVTADKVGWVSLATLTINGDSDAAGFPATGMRAPWLRVRARVARANLGDGRVRVSMLS